MQKLWFLCMTHCLNVLIQKYEVSLKYLNGYQVIEWTRFCDGQTHRQAQGGKVYMQELFVCDTWSECALEMYSFVEVPLTVIKL